MEEMQRLRQAVCDCARKAYARGLFAGTSGNISAYDAAAGLMAITPGSLPYEQMQAQDVVLLRPDGTPVAGERRPSSEWRLHAALYRGRPQLGAVVHTHSPYATAFAAARRPIPAALIESAAFLDGAVPLAPFALPGSWELGESALRALGEGPACLLENHGVVTVGGNLEQAALRAVYVEDAARICLLASLLGGAAALPEDTVQQIRQL